MKIEDLKVGRVYRAKRPRVVHTLGGSYINDRQILYIAGLPAEIQVYKIDDYADLDHSDGCPLLGVIVVNEPDSEPVIYLR